MRLTYYLYLLAGLLLCAPVFAELPKPESFPLLSRSGTYHMEVPLDKQQRYWLHEKRELQLGASAPDYPPFDMTVSGQDFEGLTADYAGILARPTLFRSTRPRASRLATTRLSPPRLWTRPSPAPRRASAAGSARRCRRALRPWSRWPRRCATTLTPWQP